MVSCPSTVLSCYITGRYTSDAQVLSSKVLLKISAITAPMNTFRSFPKLSGPVYAFPSRSAAGQRRSITIKQLEAAKNGRHEHPISPASRLTCLLRSNPSRHPGLWMGRLQPCQITQPKEVPDSDRLATFLLRLHTTSCIHLSRHARVSNST